MHKFLAITAVALICCFVGYAGATPPRLGVLTDGVSDFWTAMRESMTAEAEEAGVVLDFRMPAPATVGQQRELATQMVEAGIQALAVAPVRPEQQTEWINELASQTAVMTLRTDAPQSERLAYLGRDERELGRMLARIAVGVVPEGVKVMAFSSTPEIPMIKERIAGLEETFDEFLTVLDEVVPDQGDRMLARANLDDILRERPEISCLIGLNEYHGPLMVGAVMDGGRARWVRIVSVGSSSEMKMALENGIVHGLVDDSAEDFGRLALETLQALAAGEARDAVPESAIIVGPLKAITPAEMPTVEEMMNGLQLQVPWIPEVAPGAP